MYLKEGCVQDSCCLDYQGAEMHLIQPIEPQSELQGAELHLIQRIFLLSRVYQSQ
jgi:hypothetical protein